MYSIDSKPNVNCGPWVIVTCYSRFISGHKYTPLVADADNGGSCVCIGMYGKFLYLPLNFAVSLKPFF